MATVSQSVSKRAVFSLFAHYSATIPSLFAHYSVTPVSRTGASFMITKGIIMKQRYILFRRSGVFYYEDTTVRKQILALGE